MRKSFLKVLFSTLLLAAVIWWIDLGTNSRNSPTNPDASVPAHTVQEPEISPETDVSEVGVLPVKLRPGSSAKKIVHAPSGKPKFNVADVDHVNATSLNHEEFEEFVRHNLDLALSGDLEAAVRLTNLKNLCRVMPKSQVELEDRIENVMRNLKKAREHNAIPPGRTDAEHRAEFMLEYNNCLKQAEILDGMLRGRLETLAQQGNVVARYLFASLPPSYMSSANAFLVLQEWEFQAKEFSFLNLEQGEVAGLVAFGKSYMDGKLFTQRDDILGRAFLLAAFNCGYVDSDTQRFVDKIPTAEDIPESELNRVLEFLAVVEKLTAYCR